MNQLNFDIEELKHKPDGKYLGIKSHHYVEQEWCFECGQMKPYHPNFPNDSVHPCMDWRKAERPSLDHPIPESPMCFACYCRIRDEYSPLAPYWDKDGHKHFRTPEEIEQRKKELAE